VRYNVLIADDKYREQLKPVLDPYFEGSDISFEYVDSPQRAVERVKYDDVGIDIVLMDIKFEDRYEGLEGGIWAVREIKGMDPDLPVGMITEYPMEHTAFQAGGYRASFYLPKDDFLPGPREPSHKLKKLEECIKEALRAAEPRYDRLHMLAANKLAKTYEEEEAKGPATVSFMRWENDLILQVVEKLSSDEEVRCLDVGCGTGRYEILLSSLNRPNLSIWGIDFSGGMVKRAEENISKLPSRLLQ